MQYIIIDLEWNQPLSYDSAVYRRVGSKLIFEMIQIGAVRVNERMEILDSVSIPIRPQQYVRIHPRIRRMTHLDEETLAGALTFEEAIEQFASWCGEDYALLTWGCDDISVLQQNLDFYDCHPKLADFYDIQKMFSDVFECKDRKSLKAAMEMLEIEPDEERAFHNALNDAYYTALVFARIPQPENVVRYVQHPKQLIHQLRGPAIHQDAFPNVAAALSSALATAPVCPACGKQAATEDRYAEQTGDKYIGLAKCKTHGMLLVRLRLTPDDNGGCLMSVKASKASRQDVAYVHTKLLQLRRREEAFAAQGITPDPDRDLRNADRSSMPTED